jgi:peptidyl-prolyl cis-trans isomerase C
MAWTAWAQPAKEASSSDTVARVNGVAVTHLELNRLFLAHAQVPYSLVQEDPRAQEVRRQLLDLLIDRHLLLQEAKTLNMTVSQQELDEEFQGLITRFPSKEAFEETLKEQDLTPEAIRKNLGDQLLRQQLVKKEILEKVSVRPHDLQDFYQSHQNKYVEEEQVRARHILIKVPPETSAADEAKLKDKADGALQRARKGEDFGALAQELSEDGSRADGGDLGFFGRGRTVAPFEEAAFALTPGEISDLVRTQFGYHIIRVEAHKPARALSYDEAKDQVTEDVKRERTIARYQEYVGGLRDRANIEVLLP